MNLPNKLTVSRLALTVLFVVAIFWQVPFNDTVALLLFITASLTDVFDGLIARRRNLTTNFGILMDPLADKVLICSAFVALVERHMYAAAAGTLPVAFHIGQRAIYPKVAAWMVVVIVARELVITGLRLLAASKNVVLAAERYGKHKTFSQTVAVIALLTLEAAKEWGSDILTVLTPWGPAIALIALWGAVTLTAFSGAVYLWRNRHIYLAET
ncbi:MAG: CDP-alcohol phosphatidyltransferase family protein [Verrucomicrobiae bacterium]|nr:CDP-alcohol phosphatidyltransferase family protein [Verrucomicrobiae bacterium]MCX7722018.1 CDP-alcohol phosphatidyltransferase family protein [Verrucomicrobiae bacterium]MDW7979741.1 CDP-alcohol phosphatidyltransferase family protein [Verrucomicrobiales bacterium]